MKSGEFRGFRENPEIQGKERDQKKNSGSGRGEIKWIQLKTSGTSVGSREIELR